MAGLEQWRAPSSLRPDEMDLPDLLGQMQRQVTTVIDVRDRLYELLNAVISIGSNLELSEVLDRIVRAGMELVQARYGALAVLDAHGERVEEFIYHGVDADEAAPIGHYPEGLGILGVLIKEPRPLRLSDINAHPEAYGFPPNHPHMRTFLGVPVLVRDVVFGNLYFTEKTDGKDFDEADEDLLTALATAAGVAIENARLYQETQLSDRSREASSAIVSALLSGLPTTEVLTLVAEWGRRLADAVHANILLPTDDENGMRIVATSGEDTDKMLGMNLTMTDGRAGAVYRTGVPESWDGYALSSMPTLAEIVEIGPRLVIPLGEAGQTRGVLVVYNRRGKTFRPKVLETLTTFAEQAALAIELFEQRRAAESVLVYEERERIARNLHDLVIQRLFATGMGIENATRMIGIEPRTVARRLGKAVEDIDATIREIRSTIFALQNTDAPLGLRSRVLDVVTESTSALGFEPSVHFAGLIDTNVPIDVSDDLIAVLREALANVARHARATSCGVQVAVGDDVVLEVTDDGVGLPETGRRSGLANLAERARRLGGSFTTQAGGSGTSLRWQVPLRRTV
ncbi:MAG TPA: GAF domain-containing protein [Streptosporangiales bacterium]